VGRTTAPFWGVAASTDAELFSFRGGQVGYGPELSQPITWATTECSGSLAGTAKGEVINYCATIAPARPSGREALPRSVLAGLLRAYGAGVFVPKLPCCS
jgi:hypothetical protein